MNEPIRFNDGAGYERFMGKWSRLVGASFLDWVAPQPHLRWLDVGCGNGAFTELFVERHAPKSVSGIDPSAAQLAYARTRPTLRDARFVTADAMSLPFPDASFDIAVMPLVIFFVPDPSKGVAEMVRVVAPGGTVCAYAWDIDGGGFPYDLLRSEMRALGADSPLPPTADASRMDALQEMWLGAGLEGIETRRIRVERPFTDFEEYWDAVLSGPHMGTRIAALRPQDAALLLARMRERLGTDAAGRIIGSAQANAITGRVRQAG